MNRCIQVEKKREKEKEIEIDEKKKKKKINKDVNIVDPLTLYLHKMSPKH